MPIRMHFADGQQAALLEELAHGRAVDELHHDVGGAVVVTGVVGGDDVGVVQARGRDRFVPKARPRRRVGREVVAQDLHRDASRQHRIVGDPHGRHPTSREWFDEVVSPTEYAPGSAQGTT